MTLEEYATEVLAMMRRVAEGIEAESKVTVQAAQQPGQPQTIEGLLVGSERLGYVRGLMFTQTLISQESQRLVAQYQYDEHAPQ